MYKTGILYGDLKNLSELKRVHIFEKLIKNKIRAFNPFDLLIVIQSDLDASGYIL